MDRRLRSSVAAVLCAAVVGAGVAACSGELDQLDDWDPPASSSGSASATPSAISGTQKIQVNGKSVNVSCSGEAADGEPVVILMHGMGDGVEKLAPLQQEVSKKHRVCSYDRLGAGASDKPGVPQNVESAGYVLDGVLDQIAGKNPVVLAGHSLGGLLAARYAPEHTDRVKGLVLMDATPPTMEADISNAIPENAQGPAAELRAQTLAQFHGENPEQLTVADGEVKSAGDIPVEVIQHGQPYLEAIPQYGKKLEQAWAAGQRKWLGLSSNAKPSTAEKSGHYIYVDQPDVAVQAIDRVAGQVQG